MTKHLEMIERLRRGEIEPPPIAKLIGFDLVGAEVGSATFEMQASARHANPMGTLHGGILCDLADAAMGFAMSTTLADDETFTSLDLSIKFLKPIWNQRIRAKATVVKRSRTLGLLECDVTDEKGSLVARAWSTCTVLRGDEAKGR